MSKEYNETKLEPAPSVSRESEKINGSVVQNIFSQKKYKINFDDKKYAVKVIKTQFAKVEQQPSKLMGFLKSIPVIGGILAKFFTLEEKVYKKLRLQAGHPGKAKSKVRIDNKHTEEVGSRLSKSGVEQVNKQEKNLDPHKHGHYRS